MERPSITFELPLSKITQSGKRAKYATRNDADAWNSETVVGNLYPTRFVIEKAFGKVPEKVKITIEEAA